MMKTTIALLLTGLLTLTLFAPPCKAQQNTTLDAQPHYKQLKRTPVLNLGFTDVDIQNEIKETNENIKRKARDYALLQKNYGLSSNELGKWTTLKSGDRVWHLKVCSKGATGLGFRLNNIVIPEGAYFFFYNKNKERFIGPITKKSLIYDRQEHKLELLYVKGDEVFIEFFEPQEYFSKINFSIESIFHRFDEFPYSFSHPISKEVATLHSPLQEKIDKYKQTRNKKPISSYISPNWTPNNSGTWHDLPNGDKLWRLKLDGTQLNIDIKNTSIDMKPFKVSKGVVLFIYSEDGTYVSEKIGKYRTVYQNKIIPNKVIILELYVPKEVDNTDYKLNINLYGHAFSQVNHSQRDEGVFCDTGAHQCIPLVNCLCNENNNQDFIPDPCSDIITQSLVGSIKNAVTRIELLDPNNDG